MQDRARPTRGKFARVPTARSPIGKPGERGQRNERDRGHDRTNARLVGKMPGSLEEQFSDQSRGGVSVEVHARDVDCRKKLFISRKRIGTQRSASEGVDIDEDFRSVGDELPDPRIERGLIAVLWEGEPGEVEHLAGGSLRPTLRYAIRWRSGESACGPSAGGQDGRYYRRLIVENGPRPGPPLAKLMDGRPYPCCWKNANAEDPRQF